MEISPCHSPVAACPGCSTTDFIAAGAAEAVAGGKPVNIVQNLSGDLIPLIDGGAEPHYDTDDVGDRTGPAASTSHSWEY
eukprot:4936405-Prymnesium_polylepis.1